MGTVIEIADVGGLHRRYEQRQHMKLSKNDYTSEVVFDAPALRLSLGYFLPDRNLA